jgi:cell division protein FtsW
VCGSILPANLSTAAVLFATSMVVLFIGRVNLKFIGIMIGSGIVMLTIFVSLALVTYKAGMVNSLNQRAYTWINRTTSFVDGNSEDNYQAQQAKIAIATGGLTGKGPGGSTQRNFLPHPYSDFIYAIIIEEYGFIGGALVLVLYVLLFYRCILIVKKNPRAFAALLSVGCGFSLVFQGMINMAVATSLGPVTGQPLPLLSMGGTSIIFTAIAIGIILSVSRESENEEGGSFATA